MKKNLMILVTILIGPAMHGLAIDHQNFTPGEGFELQTRADGLRVSWNAPEGRAFLDLRLSERTGKNPFRNPIIRQFGIDDQVVLENLEPTYMFWVGNRDLEKRAGWSIFFDRVPNKPFAVEKGLLSPGTTTVSRHGGRVMVEIEGLESASFAGSLVFILYEGSPFVHMEARVATARPATAFLYHVGLGKQDFEGTRLHWFDALGNPRSSATSDEEARVYQTRYRAMALSSARGSVAIAPFHHQFSYPLDFVDNYGYNWAGSNYLEMIDGFAWGVRQPPLADRRYTPWVNAPPGTVQKMGVLLFVSKQDGTHCLNTANRYTRNDSFKPLPGYKTFTSHYHIEHSLNFIKQQQEQNVSGIPAGLENPDFVTVFKDMGVDIVHLGEFHRVLTPGMGTMERLGQLKVMHDECARLSGDGFLLLPGEEPNVHLGGHWMSFFPKPVNWVLNRDEGQPFEQQLEGFGTVYHVGSVKDVHRLLKQENGLAWTAHPRIKGSTGYPDNYKDSEIFQSEEFLGAAWKAMPSDYSRDTLGWQALDLQDDMANWSVGEGNRKYTIGEVDIFRIFRDYELFGAMNINYLKLDDVPEYQNGWQPVLDVLRQGRFFVTTGEVLIPEFSVGGRESGETLPREAGQSPVALRARLEWTYPLSHLEIVSGDGAQVYRERIDLSDTKEFGQRELNQNIDLTDRTWVRMEVWDIARNGAFTQPVWIQ